MIASANRASSKTLADPTRKVVYIDDLEIPSRKGTTIEQLYAYILKVHGTEALEMFKQSFIDFKTKRTTSFFLLQELERVYGISKGFKYYWSLAVATKTDAVEMQKEMKKSTNKMSFRHQTCLLQQYSSSYYELFINICYILNDHLESKAEDMELQTESRINATLVAMAQISSGHIAQCRSL